MIRLLHIATRRDPVIRIQLVILALLVGAVILLATTA